MSLFMYRGPAIPAVESAECTFSTVGQYLVDAALNLWQFGTAVAGGNQVLKNGAQYFSGAADSMRYHNHSVYTHNTSTGWFLVISTGYSAVSGDPCLTTPSWVTLPALSMAQGGSISLSQYIVNPQNTPILSYSVQTGTLPTGVTLNTTNGVLTATSSATIGPDAGLSFGFTF